MLFGPKLTTVFASRWKALAWSATILLTAYSVATDGIGPGGGGAAASTQDADHQPAPSSQASSSPWTIDTSQK